MPQNNSETTTKIPYELNDEIREVLEHIIPENHQQTL